MSTSEARTRIGNEIDPEAMLRAAQANFEQGADIEVMFRYATDINEHSLAIPEERIQANLLLAKTYFREGRPVEAKATLEAALSMTLDSDGTVTLTDQHQAIAGMIQDIQSREQPALSSGPTSNHVGSGLLRRFIGR